MGKLTFMNAIALYNNDQILWNNYHASETKKPHGGAILTVHDGHIGNGYEVLARFETTKAAEDTLRTAGYAEIEPHKFKARATYVIMAHRLASSNLGAAVRPLRSGDTMLEFASREAAEAHITAMDNKSPHVVYAVAIK